MLEIRFSADVDAISGTFRMTAQHQQALNDGGEVELADAGATARISLLTRFPIAEPHPAAVYKFSNPWGLALSEDGRNLYLTDASQNCLLRIDTATGRWQRLARFGPFRNPTTVGPPVVDAVPTSVRIYGDSVLVSFLSGFPFASANGRVLIVNPETGALTRSFSISPQPRMCCGGPGPATGLSSSCWNSARIRAPIRRLPDGYCDSTLPVLRLPGRSSRRSAWSLTRRPANFSFWSCEGRFSS